MEVYGMTDMYIHIISDSTGETAEQIVKASVAQFDMTEPKIIRHSGIRDSYDLEELLDEILQYGPNQIVYFSLVNDELLDLVNHFCELHNIIHVDVLTPSIGAIQRLIHKKPSVVPGAYRQLDEEYFQRVEAIEFTVRYDDGKDPRGVLSADLVIVGVSRTSKTPLSMYLANKNYKVTNIPIVPESQPPEEIYQVPSSKVIGLTNSPDNLAKIRKERLKSLGVSDRSSYSDMARILDELEFAHNIMKRIGCPIIDVSNRAIEETADIIIRHLNKIDHWKGK